MGIGSGPGSIREPRPGYRAPYTTLDPELLNWLGYDLSALTETVEVRTASGIVNVTRLELEHLEAFGEVRTDLLVTVLALPEGSIIQGLLGLDFFRGRVLKIDFVSGVIELT